MEQNADKLILSSAANEKLYSKLDFIGDFIRDVLSKNYVKLCNKYFIRQLFVSRAQHILFCLEKWRIGYQVLQFSRLFTEWPACVRLVTHGVQLGNYPE